MAVTPTRRTNRGQMVEQISAHPSLARGLTPSQVQQAAQGPVDQALLRAGALPPNLSFAIFWRLGRLTAGR